EVGRGPLAGPVMAAAVVLPSDCNYLWLAQVRDSKLLTARVREYLAQRIREVAMVGTAAVPPAAVDALGIAVASRRAMLLAVQALPQPPHHLLVDGFALPECPLPQTPMVDGDARSLSIACASIVAKVQRDQLMAEVDFRYPGYGFARHKGYATAEHRAALARLGPCPIHRRSFAPVRALLEARA
ncbi:MAG: ribonuclease HII, partial [Dehalococcoidia bacterium]